MSSRGYVDMGKKKACDKRYREKHKEEIRDKYKENGKQFYKENRDKIIATRRKWEGKNRERIKGYKLKYKYGLTMQEFYNMIAEQGGTCSICKKPDWGAAGPIVDHDHKTGRVRGILCKNCNSMLGLSGDNKDNLMSAVHYLYNSEGNDVS